MISVQSLTIRRAFLTTRPVSLWAQDNEDKRRARSRGELHLGWVRLVLYGPLNNWSKAMRWWWNPIIWLAGRTARKTTWSFLCVVFVSMSLWFAIAVSDPETHARGQNLFLPAQPVTTKGMWIGLGKRDSPYLRIRYWNYVSHWVQSSILFLCGELDLNAHRSRRCILISTCGGGVGGLSCSYDALCARGNECSVMCREETDPRGIESFICGDCLDNRGYLHGTWLSSSTTAYGGSLLELPNRAPVAIQVKYFHGNELDY